MKRRMRTAVFSLVLPMIVGLATGPCAAIACVKAGQGQDLGITQVDLGFLSVRIPIHDFSIPFSEVSSGDPGTLLVINEVYYDHPGSDTGWEFVELLNAGADPIPMGGYRLEFIDGLSGGVRTLWECHDDATLVPGGRLLVSGENVPGGAVRLLGALENGPDAVRLVSPSGAVDLVGYGESPYSEGVPAPDVGEGTSISRKPDGRDSDCNSSDFVPALPTPGRPNFYGCDLALSIGHAPVPCTGQPSEAEIHLDNPGLEDFTGQALIGLSIGSVPSGGGTVLDVDLESGETASFPLALPAAPPGSFIIEISLEAPGDENTFNDTTRVRLRSSPGKIVINEIMYRGGSEWIELKSRAPGPVSLRGWHISDATGHRRLIDEGDLSIGPGDFLILAQDVDLFRIDHPLCASIVTAVAGGWPWLNDTDDGTRADLIELRDGGGVLVERIEYRDLVGDEKGRSIERFSADVCSSFPGGLWHRSVAADRSTPGSENSIALRGDLPAPSEVRIDPNPYHPFRDGTVGISGMTAEGESGLLVRIFDISGREVGKLFGERGGASAFSCYWDGRDVRGRDVETGLYICIVEFVGPGGGVCRREKRCIALYR
jgi:hypothetical protein